MAKQQIQIDCQPIEWLYIPDVEYHQYGTVSRKLQMIVPFGTEKTYPLIVYLPGSAFYRQEMYLGVPQFARLARRGYVVAALQYRESEIAKFPAQVQDVHNAISFLKEKASDFHIDPDKIFLMGHSSGGYNALMAGLTTGLPEFDGGANHRIRGIVPMSAPCCLKFEMGMTIPGKVSYDPNDYRPELDMLGLARFEDDPPLCRRARPDTYVTPDRRIPPIALIHGDQDSVVHIDNSRNFYAALQNCGTEATLYEIVGKDHGGAWLWDDQTLDIVDHFFQEALR